MRCARQSARAGRARCTVAIVRSVRSTRKEALISPAYVRTCGPYAATSDPRSHTCRLWREHDDLIIYQPEEMNSGSAHLSRDNEANSGRFIERLVIRIHHAMGATVVHEDPL